MSDADGKSGILRRRYCEALGWIATVGFLWTVDTLSKISERNQTGVGKDNLRLITDQVTSALGVLIMIAFVVYWVRLFPLRRDAWRRAVPGHIAGTIIFAYGHFSLSVAFRSLFYKLAGLQYFWIESFVANLFVEYQKDIKIYIGIVVIISAYQYYRSTRPDLQRAATPGRLVVQTGGGESVLRFEQIDFLEASRNYVVVHAGGREYLVRETMKNLVARLQGGPFARTHRSFVINVDRISEIKSVDSSYEVRLSSGAVVPLSRSYRDALKSQLGT